MLHWDELKDKIKEKGIFYLVPDSGEEAAKILRAQADGTATPEQYDPLMDAHNKIMVNAVDAGGIYLLSGNHCPLCELNENAPKDPGQVLPWSVVWVQKASEEVLAACIERGLQPRPG